MGDATLPIIIVGGGVSGCIAAMLLCEYAPVYLFERETELQAKQDARSINVTMCSRGLSVFKRVDELRGTTLAASLLEKGVGLEGRLIHTAGAKAGGLVAQPYGRKGQAIYSMKRSLLVQTCREALSAFISEKQTEGQRLFPIKTYYGQRYLGIEWHVSGPGRTVVSFLDTVNNKTHQVTGRLVIGADGAHSDVRKAVCQRSYMDYRVDHSDYGYVELSIPAAENPTLQAHQNLFHFWPRNQMMMWAMANRDGTFSSTFVMPMEKLTKLSADAQLDEFLQQTFSDVKFNPETAGRKIGSLLTVCCSKYHFGGEVVLIGDAAHTLVPFAGQGMNSALVDCAILYEALSKHPNDWESALEEFTAIVKPNAEAIADFALANFEELRSKTSRPLFNLFKRVEAVAHSLMPNTYIPLHTMINFRDDISYQEAARRSEKQRKLLATFLGVSGAAALALVAFTWSEFAPFKSKS